MAVEVFIPPSSLRERERVCVNVPAHVCIQGDVITPPLHCLKAKGENLQFTFGGIFKEN